jgi:hypothetical protein
MRREERMEVVITQNKQELERLEWIIQENIGAFFEIGDALMKIRENKYYHDVLGYETFGEYCRKRWDYKRTYTFYLIESAKVINNVHDCEQKPTNEWQVRPLTKIKDPEVQLIVWQKAVKTAPNGKVTAAHVYKIMKGMNINVAKPKREPQTIEVTEAIGISTFIICHLERIREDDPKRDEAIRKIINWCDENIERRK